MALRLALNATPLLSPLTGIGNYIVELGSALAGMSDVDAYSFYGFRWRHEPPTRVTSSRGRPRAVYLRNAIKRWLPFKRELRVLQQQLAFARGLRRNGIHVYHEPNYVPIRYDVPVVITVHDLSWIHFPHAHPADRVRWLERGLPTALMRAAVVLVDSHFVRDDLLRHFSVAADRVRVTTLGVSDRFRPREPAETTETLASLGLEHGRYILSVGTIEPRKNIGHLLEAYALLTPETRERYPLVIAGAQGWRAETLQRTLRRLADCGQIRFLGRVDDQTLMPLYAGATVFVFPSLYEGFGLPPLEAMASGVPVLVSQRASLPEIVGDAGATFDPDSVDETAARLAELLADPAARAHYASLGRARARGFTWRRCAEQTVAAYRAAVS